MTNLLNNAYMMFFVSMSFYGMWVALQRFDDLFLEIVFFISYLLMFGTVLMTLQESTK